MKTNIFKNKMIKEPTENLKFDNVMTYKYRKFYKSSNREKISERSK